MYRVLDSNENVFTLSFEHSQWRCWGDAR